MATGKRQRDSTVIDELELPVTKRHATAGGPLKGLQKVSTQARTMYIHVQYTQPYFGTVKLTSGTLWLMVSCAFVWTLGPKILISMLMYLPGPSLWSILSSSPEA